LQIEAFIIKQINSMISVERNNIHFIGGDKMAKDWDYALATQKMAAAGGPVAWIDTIKKAAYSNGASDMKKKITAPLLMIGVGAGTLGTLGVQKISRWVKLHGGNGKAVLINQEAAIAEELLKKELNVASKEVSEEIINEN